MTRPTPLKLMQRYVLGEVWSPFFAAVVFFTFVFLMFQTLRLAEFFIVHGVSLPILAKMTALMAMNVMPLCLPIAFLLAVLVGLGRLSADSELVAMKASGQSLFRISLPVFGLGSCVVVLSLLLNLSWVPWSQRSFQRLLIRVGNLRAVGALHEGTFNSNFYDLLIFADKIDSKTNRMERVFLYDAREPKHPVVIVSKTGKVFPVRTGDELKNASILMLENGSIHRNAIEESTYHKIDFTEDKIYLKPTEGNAGLVEKPEMIPASELVERIKTSDTETYQGREWRGELWRRIATALSPLAFVLIGFGLGTVRTRSVNVGAALATFAVLGTYYVLQTVGTIILLRGWVPPWLGMQIANLVTLAVGGYTFRRASW